MIDYADAPADILSDLAILFRELTTLSESPAVQMWLTVASLFGIWLAMTTFLFIMVWIWPKRRIEAATMMFCGGLWIVTSRLLVTYIWKAQFGILVSVSWAFLCVGCVWVVVELILEWVMPAWRIRQKLRAARKLGDPI